MTISPTWVNERSSWVRVTTVASIAIATACAGGQVVRSEAPAKPAAPAEAVAPPVAAPPVVAPPVAAPVPSAPPASAAPLPRRIPEGTVLPALLPGSEPAPEYPLEARAAGLEADVVLRILIDATGRVVDAQVVGGSPAVFAEPAIRAVKTLRFSPARVGGNPVATRVPFVLHFRLNPPR